MGCFNIQGDISQLPIFYGNRIGAILCKIESGNEYPTVKTCVGDYVLKPMCPIIYGTYDDYGGIIPDEDSKMLDILENFFQTDITIILRDFASIRTFGCDNDSLSHLHNLIDKQDDKKIRWKRVVDTGMDEDEERKLYITNNFYMVIEHESVIRQIIKEYDIFRTKQAIFKQPDMSKLYDRQIKLVKKYNLDKYDTVLDYDIKYEIESKLKESGTRFIFPSNTLFPVVRGLFENNEDGLMWLFSQYPELWKYNFDPDLKTEYVETLKFYKGLHCMQIHMFINRDYGSQWQNTQGWKRLLKVYKTINKNTLEED